ncbi:MAG TPA: hypothetical protein VLA34_12610, partial [Candidatus Krumholzibacterium sp.]|nr:hypothetical protein [Candidatus Krumholzibacterium sp.]
MIFDIVSVAYAIANCVLAVLLYVRYRKVVLSQFYAFCVACLLAMGLIGIALPGSGQESLRSVIKPAAIFLYAVFPYFFIHFVVIFVRRYEILRSRLVVVAIYFTGLFSYAMILMGYIPEPILPDGGITQSGKIFFVTWMTIFFAIGVAMMYEVARGFYEKVGRGNILLGAFIVLLLLLPGPFTETIFFNLLDVGSPGYYFASLIAVTVAVYFIFRHKIIVNTFYESLKGAVGVINDVIVTTNERLEVEMVKGGVSSLL